MTFSYQRQMFIDGIRVSYTYGLMDKPSQETGIVPAKPPKLPARIKSSKFAPCLKIILPDFSMVMVPVDKASSDAQRSILVAKATAFLEGQLDKFKDKTFTPAEIKDVIRAVSDLDSLKREQFISSINAGSGGDIGNSLQGMIKQAAHGAAQGTTQAFMDKLKAIENAGKIAAKNAEVIEVKSS